MFHLSLSDLTDLIKLATYVVAFALTMIFMYWRH